MAICSGCRVVEGEGQERPEQSTMKTQAENKPRGEGTLITPALWVKVKEISDTQIYRSVGSISNGRRNPSQRTQMTKLEYNTQQPERRREMGFVIYSFVLQAINYSNRK